MIKICGRLCNKNIIKELTQSSTEESQSDTEIKHKSKKVSLFLKPGSLLFNLPHPNPSPKGEGLLPDTRRLAPPSPPGGGMRPITCQMKAELRILNRRLIIATLFFY